MEEETRTAECFTDPKIIEIEITPEYLEGQDKPELIALVMSLLEAYGALDGKFTRLKEKYILLRDMHFGSRSEKLKWLIDGENPSDIPVKDRNQNQNTGTSHSAGSTADNQNSAQNEEKEKESGQPDQKQSDEKRDAPSQENEPEKESPADGKSDNASDGADGSEANAQSHKEDRLGNMDMETREIEIKFSQEWLNQHPGAQRMSPTEFEEYVKEVRWIRYIYKIEKVRIPSDEASDTNDNPEAGPDSNEILEKEDGIVVTAGNKKPVVKYGKASALLRCQALFEYIEAGTPFHRQANLDALSSHEILAQNYLNWCHETWLIYFMPMYLLLMEIIMDTHTVFMDESRYVVNSLRKLLEKKNGDCWMVQCRTGSYEEKQIIMYYLFTSRCEDFMYQILDMEGGEYAIHSDKYAAYLGWINVINVLCHDHNRRSFVNAAKVEGGLDKYKEIVQKHGAASQEAQEWLDRTGNETLKDLIKILQLYQILYQNERNYKDEKLTPKQIKERRNMESRPVLNEIYSIVERYYVDKGKPVRRKREKKEDYDARVKEWEQTLKEVKEFGMRVISYGTEMADAVIYAQRNKAGFYEYLNNGEYQISNICAETGWKSLARIRNNSMFSGSVEGGVMTAGMLSIIKTYELNGYKPLETMVYIVETLAAVREEDKEFDRELLESLLPWSGQLPEHLKIGNPSPKVEQLEDGDILYFSGDDRVPVARRNPKKEEEYRKMSETNPGSTFYHQSRILSRRKKRAAERTIKHQRKPLPVEQTLPQRLCS